MSNPAAPSSSSSLSSSSSSSATTTAEAPEPFISKTTFGVGSLITISAGAFLGVHRVLTQENIKLDMRSHRAPFLTATKALAGGTLLCFGTFSLCTSLFVATTGITSFSEFGRVMRASFAKVDGLHGASQAPLALRDRQQTQNMSEEDELSYFGREYFAADKLQGADASNGKNSSGSERA